MHAAPEVSHQQLSELRHIIQQTCLHRGTGDQMTAPEGRRLSWCFDLRPLLLNGRTLKMIVAEFWRHFSAREPFQLCSPEVAAIPLMAALITKGHRDGRDINGLIVRKQPKRYGLRRQLEGSIDHNPILVVDDLINSGKSLEHVRKTLAAIPSQLMAVFTVIDFQSPAGLAWRRRHQIPVTSLFTLQDFGLRPPPSVIQVGKIKFPEHPIPEPETGARQLANEIAGSLRGELVEVTLIDLPPEGRQQTTDSRSCQHGSTQRYLTLITGDSATVQSNVSAQPLAPGEVWWQSDATSFEIRNNGEQRCVLLVIELAQSFAPALLCATPAAASATEGE